MKYKYIISDEQGNLRQIGSNKLIQFELNDEDEGTRYKFYMENDGGLELYTCADYMRIEGKVAFAGYQALVYDEEDLGEGEK
jgi:hypothetical protein